MRRNSGPTWLVWWLLPLVVFGWPLIAFERRPSYGHDAQLTTTGWIAEAIWLVVLLAGGMVAFMAYLYRPSRRKPAAGRSGTPDLLTQVWWLRQENPPRRIAAIAIQLSISPDAVRHFIEQGPPPELEHVPAAGEPAVTCRHEAAVAVDPLPALALLGAERHAMLCPDCGTQLPADFNPPVPPRRWARVITS